MSTVYFHGYHECQLVSLGLYSKLYTAYRDEDNAPVVIKMPKSSPLKQEEEEALRHEMRIMELLKDSPSIPRFYGEEAYEKTFFMVMEKIDSPSITSILSEKRIFEVEEFLHFALAAVTALENIHRFDIIHKDINDHNIFYNKESKKCMLVDFDLSISINHQKVIPVNPNYLEGTLPYISPEQSGRMNRGIDYRTDYYSLGVLFYRALTGELPFFSRDPLELVHMHLAILPRPPERLEPSIPPILSNIILKLLAKDPEGRYQSIAGIRGDLNDCLNGLKEGKIEPFPLGTHDTHERFQIPEKIYGREEEIERLLLQYERVIEGGSGLVLIGGYSGVGKTSLVHEMYKPIAEKQGTIISGKFEQFKHNIPYFAFTQALDEFIKGILTESNEILERFRARVLAALERNGQIIVDAIPSLEMVIGKQPHVPRVGLEETQNRFAYVFQRFIHSLPSEERPILLFLDDLQWADLPSFRLMESLLEVECPYLLIVGGYRDNEVDEKHPLSLLIKSLGRQNIACEILHLEPLKISDVRDLIADTLYRKEEEIEALAEICFAKTAGNPFFLIQFLESLYESDSIRYDWSSATWIWNLDKINTAHFSDNVVELMTDKIRQLEPELQSLLASAACIGHRFSIEVLEDIRGQSRGRLRPLMETLLKKEFLISDEKHYYSAKYFQFSHSRIQEAAHGLLDEIKRVNLHIAVAENILKTITPNEMNEVIFTVVDHYNWAIEAKRIPQSVQGQRKQIAMLNFNAAKIAKEAAAYEVGLTYCRYSMKWLDEEDWESNYKFLIELYSEAMECSYLSSKFDLVEEYGIAISNHSKDILSETRAIKIRGLYYTSIGDHAGTGAILLDAFEKLGFPLPKKTSKMQVLSRLLKVFIRQKMTRRPIAKLIDLPVMKDSHSTAFVDLYGELMTAFYLSGQKELFALSNFKCLELIFRYGNSESAPIGYVTFGLIIAGIGAIDASYSYGRVAIEVADRFGNPKVRTSVIYIAGTFVLHWKEELRKAAALLMQNYADAIEAGNLLYAAYSLSVGLAYSFHAGTPINEQLETSGKYEKLLTQLKNSSSLDRFYRTRSMILKLTVPQGSSSLAAKEIDEPVDATGWATKYLYQLMVGWWLRDFDKAMEAIEAFRRYEGALGASYSITLFHFYKTLTLLTLYDTFSSMQHLSIRHTIKHGIGHFKKYAKYCRSNHLHKYLLLKAEWSRVNGKITQAERLYEQAIKCAAKEKFIHEAAIIGELAGRFYLKQNRPWIAALFLRGALSDYEMWGARNKVELLEEEFQELLEEHEQELERGEDRETTFSVTKKTLVEDRTIKIGSAALDTSTIQKSVQTITSTILMDDLLDNLMTIAMEHAGAEKGVLLMAKGDEFFIEAEGDKGTGKTRLLPSVEVSSDNMPKNVLQNVIRSQAPLLLKEAFRDRHFKIDPYIKAGRIRSILCLPLMNKDRITAILYLENNLAKNAFTEERCSLLYFLSSQLAIAIDNAKLYQGTIQLNEDLRKLNLSYERFVPKDFLSLLGKKQITEVALGDHKQQNMSVLFMDIRGFTNLSEKMTPTENFAFINEFLGIMEPIIRLHNGFIDKYIGDAIMALFPEMADDALTCAVEMIKVLDQYNKLRKERQEPQIRIGIGINSGQLILGTVGNDKRMDGTVISDAVNVASRVEHLTKEYGQSILITENTLRQLKNSKRYPLQKLAETEIRGKKEKMTIYGLNTDING